METHQLSPNGFLVTDVFNSEFLEKLIEFCNTFVPTHEWPAGDSPELSAPLPTAHREVYLFDKTHKLRQQIIKELDIQGTINIELWRDYPGYRNLLHTDFEFIRDVMIIYLDGTDTETMGTCFYEPDQYIIPYTKNTGMLLFNSDQVTHGMIGEVTGVDYRRCLYINWIKDETNT